MNRLQYVPGTMLNDSNVPSYLLLTPSPWGRCFYCLGPTNENTETWKEPQLPSPGLTSFTSMFCFLSAFIWYKQQSELHHIQATHFQALDPHLVLHQHQKIKTKNFVNLLGFSRSCQIALPSTVPKSGGKNVIWVICGHLYKQSFASFDKPNLRLSIFLARNEGEASCSAI